MSGIIVADTGPLIALAILDLLKIMPELFSDIFITEGVLEEALKDESKPGAAAISRAVQDGWISKHEIEDSSFIKDLAKLLDRGEAESLALAKQINAIALIDEKRGRKVALSYSIPMTGTAAILIKAKQSGYIKEVSPLLETLSKHGYRLSSRLVEQVLKLSGE